MSENHPERALQLAETAHLDLAELKRQLKLIGEELGYLKAFNQRLLHTLKAQWKLDDRGLDELMQQAALAQDKVIEKPGSRPAELCAHCGRPLQMDSIACIYCGTVPTNTLS